MNFSAEFLSLSEDKRQLLLEITEFLAGRSNNPVLKYSTQRIEATRDHFRHAQEASEAKGRRLNAALTNANDEVAETEAEIEADERKLSRLQSRLDSLRETLDVRKNRATSAAGAYEDWKQEHIELNLEWKKNLFYLGNRPAGAETKPLLAFVTPMDCGLTARLFYLGLGHDMLRTVPTRSSHK